ncbi:hypothetical protein L915_16304 [Phytophthora nicotianae]|uniref:Uncharacterized protein n=1 Tax=Phytophthora nicotianae TaxID=4792 RepID=W2I9T1_PHYNI|nr:hypothetical protein L915_16304 [Phytophthora nicotianae]ETL30855.1 hypothetical protein L916_16201 [Phytophthora nicotianae]
MVGNITSIFLAKTFLLICKLLLLCHQILVLQINVCSKLSGFSFFIFNHTPLASHICVPNLHLTIIRINHAGAAQSKPSSKLKCWFLVGQVKQWGSSDRIIPAANVRGDTLKSRSSCSITKNRHLKISPI